mmetsp:Transcript_21170/g.29357  ORF Transcript_21170/g.29357 Transcript_21170/m.29357 type:complete len:216 (+) Transcript_21170:2593-3240(+)
MKVLLGHRAEEMDAALVDSQDNPSREQTNGILDTLHHEKNGVSVGKRPQDAQHLHARVLLRELLEGFVALLDVGHPVGMRARDQHLLGEVLLHTRSQRLWRLHYYRTHLSLDLEGCELGSVIPSYWIVALQIVVLRLHVGEVDEHGLGNRLVRLAEHTLLEQHLGLHCLFAVGFCSSEVREHVGNVLVIVEEDVIIRNRLACNRLGHDVLAALKQ